MYGSLVDALANSGTGLLSVASLRRVNCDFSHVSLWGIVTGLFRRSSSKGFFACPLGCGGPSPVSDLQDGRETKLKLGGQDHLRHGACILFSAW